ncbi:hypothetical protein DPMN_112975 [Dreissena polymorpha]|uniref:Uncharacterized protein n=1 Tax=Dreissena polymorpha TaxID=45954 RepID=A0A9D4KGQ0_DREPO|nr:hypothetical protein DPMN_112975 [Dreissena polymorpha]
MHPQDTFPGAGYHTPVSERSLQSSLRIGTNAPRRPLASPPHGPVCRQLTRLAPGLLRIG